MKVLLLAPGSRGDVVPAARLAHDAAADGHEVTMVANAEYADVVAGAGARHTAINATLSPQASADGKPAGVRDYLAALRTYMAAAADATLLAAPGSEAVITNAISPYGHDLAEGLGIPSAEALLQPADPSRDYPPMIASARDLGPGNRLAGRLSQLVSTPYDAQCARVRAELGLAKQSRRAAQRRRRAAGMPVHHGISPAVLPRPADWPAPLTLDGFWWPVDEPGFAPPAEVADFLQAGPPPVVVTLGSLPAGTGLVDAVRGAVGSTAARFVLQGAEFAGLAGEFGPDRVQHVAAVPHEWLFAQAAAVVHQAGAGVASAALRAGVASVPVPIHTDQPFWARRLVALGAATRPAPAKGLEVAGLSERIETALGSPELGVAARRVRDAMADDPGTAPLRQWLARHG